MLLFCLILGVVSVIGFVGGLMLMNTYTWDIVGVILAFVCVLTFLVAALAPPITYASRSYGRTECRHWSEQTGRPAKFSILTSWDSGTCLTKDVHGRWISKDDVRAFAPAR